MAKTKEGHENGVLHALQFAKMTSPSRRVMATLTTTVTVYSVRSLFIWPFTEELSVKTLSDQRKADCVFLDSEFDKLT